MIAEIQSATAAEWQSFLRIIAADAVAHGIPEDLAEDVAQGAALALCKRTAPFPAPREGRPGGMRLATALTRGTGRKFGYQRFLPRSLHRDNDAPVDFATRQEAMRQVPNPADIAARAELATLSRPMDRVKARRAGVTLADVHAAYGVGAYALAEPGTVPSVYGTGEPARLPARGIPAQPGDGTEVRTLPYDAATEWAKAEGNRLARAERVADDRPWWMA